MAVLGAQIFEKSFMHKKFRHNLDAIFLFLRISDRSSECTECTRMLPEALGSPPGGTPS